MIRYSGVHLTILLLLFAFGCSSVSNNQTSKDNSVEDVDATRESSSNESRPTGIGLVGRKSASSVDEPTKEAVDAALDEDLGERSKPCAAMEDNQQWASAAECYKQKYDAGPQALEAGLYVIKLSLNFDRSGDLERGTASRNFFLKKWPGSPYAAPLLIIMGDDLREHGRTNEIRMSALKYYRSYLENFPSGPYVDEVRTRCNLLGGCEVN